MPLQVTDPVDWKLDLVTGELVIPLQRVSGPEGVRQRIRIKMRLIRGELFTDQDAGMPWFEGQGVDPNVVILGNQFNDELAKSETRKILNSIEGVGDIERLTASFDSSTRKMRLSWRVSTIFGVPVEDSLEQTL